jgi:hypothetical protein
MISWDNYIMRKFGKSIRKNITEIAVKQAIDIKRNQTLYAEEQKQKLEEMTSALKDFWR